MRLHLPLGLLFLTQVLLAQTFKAVNFDDFDNPEGVSSSAIAFADVDGDEDQDLLLTGNNGSARIAKLYYNNGAGNFTEATSQPFTGVAQGAVAFADVDNDQDQDVLITGLDSSLVRIAKLYRNDGTGNFSEVPATPFAGVAQSSIAFADVDSDEDQDILITGLDSSLVRIAKLYRNDGTGNFSEVPATPFAGVAQGAVAFADVDGDQDQDVLITGLNNSFVRISKLYRNDGTGSFTERATPPFDGLVQSAVAFADVDGDQHQDVLLTGWNGSTRTAKLYRNDGVGNFTEVTSAIFEGVSESSINFADVDGDEDQDVFLTGQNNSFTFTAQLYRNDGSGTFTAITPTPFEGVSKGSSALVDVDGDLDQDILLTGLNASGEHISTRYFNDGMGNFIALLNGPFVGITSGSIAFADVDGDLDQDVLLTGLDSSLLSPVSRLYLNDGRSNFREVSNVPFDEVAEGSIAFADVDGDGDQDVLLTGWNGLVRISKLYANDGTGHFTEMTDLPFEGVERSAIAFADVDGDEDQDVLITGSNNSFVRISELYLNDGAGNFTILPDTPFKGVDWGTVNFADVDGDEDQDVLITGASSSSERISELYFNDGAGNFTVMPASPFESVDLGAVAFADVDGDEDQDMLLTGRNIFFGAISKLYLNDGLGNYTEQTDTPFEEVLGSSIAFADVDGDEDQDVLLTGGSQGDRISKLYLNDGAGNFATMTGTPFEGVDNSSVAFADVDGDEDQDVLLTGWNGTAPISTLYLNEEAPPLAAFNADLTKGCAALTIVFSNASTGNATNLEWVFEGGTPATSTAENPAIVYRNPGIYDVLLIATNNVGTDTIRQENYITIDSIPISGFERAIDGRTVNFINNSSNAASYEWLFGDGTSSTMTNPVHTYEQDSTYMVQLIATNDCGSDTTAQTIDITTVQTANQAVFSDFRLFPNPNSGQFTIVLESLPAKKLTVTIRDVLGNQLYMRAFDFGSGTLQTQIVPANLSPGIYFVDIQKNEAHYLHKIVVHKFVD